MIEDEVDGQWQNNATCSIEENLETSKSLHCLHFELPPERNAFIFFYYAQKHCSRKQCFMLSKCSKKLDYSRKCSTFGQKSRLFQPNSTKIRVFLKIELNIFQKCRLFPGFFGKKSIFCLEIDLIFAPTCVHYCIYLFFRSPHILRQIFARFHNSTLKPRTRLD